MSTTDDYVFRTFPARAPGEDEHDATRAWLQADAQGFHDPRLGDASLDRSATNLANDRQQLTAVYTTAPRPAALGPEVPVATFASFERSINVGGDEPLPAHLISSITVRPTHRRHGILRRMMTDDLRSAHEAGYAVAALTVTEATIYRRFGFGPATTVHEVTVTTDQRFRLLTPASGHTELIDPATLLTLSPEVFAGFHRVRPGSVDRHHRYPGRVSGLDGPNGEEDRTVRAAAHYDDSGAIDGYVSYRFLGWDKRPHTLEVVDLVATTDAAYLGLWEFLGSVDLIERVRYDAAPADDPLRWALVDPRLIETRDVVDWLWMRVLDVRAAFEARGYTADAAGEVVLSVTDALGYAQGAFRLRVADGRAVVEAADPSEAELELDVWVLGTLFLGGVDPAVLAAAGQLHEVAPGAVSRLRTLLRPVAPVHGITHF